jgi:Fe2+ transport system protein FeoA
MALVCAANPRRPISRRMGTDSLEVEVDYDNLSLVWNQLCLVSVKL